MGNIKGKAFWYNKIFNGNSKMSLIVSNYFLIIAINSKNKWTTWYILELLWVVTFDTELQPVITNELVSCDKVILLELQGMMDLMAENDWFCKLAMDAFIFSE